VQDNQSSVEPDGKKPDQRGHNKKKAEEIAINVIKQIEMIRFIMVFPA